MNPDKVTHIVYFGVAIDAEALAFDVEVDTEEGIVLKRPATPEDIAFHAMTSGDDTEHWLPITAIHTSECRCEQCVTSMILLCTDAGIMEEVIDPETGEVKYKLADDPGTETGEPDQE